MVRNVLRRLWAEPRPAHAPVRVWRDWALVGVLGSGSVLELLLREDRAWAPLVLAVSVVVALTLLWRRAHPLAAAAVAFGTMLAWDVARIVVIDATNLLTIAGLLLLPYALFRWGSGREAAVGLGIILGWLPVTHVADATASAQVGLPPSEVVTVVGGYGFFLFSAALGAAIRFHANARVRDIEQAKLRQRNELARELHDAVGHHVSAIVIQAQAGRALAPSDPDRALATLETIEEAASRTLEEMRAMVGLLRDGAEPDFAPQPGLADIEQLARSCINLGVTSWSDLPAFRALPTVSGDNSWWEVHACRATRSSQLRRLSRDPTRPIPAIDRVVPSSTWMLGRVGGGSNRRGYLKPRGVRTGVAIRALPTPQRHAE